LSKFKSGTIRLLIASDVLARGIDIGDITHVINFDTPEGGYFIRSPVIQIAPRFINQFSHIAVIIPLYATFFSTMNFREKEGQNAQGHLYIRESHGDANIVTLMIAAQIAFCLHYFRERNYFKKFLVCLNTHFSISKLCSPYWTYCASGSRRLINII